MMPLRCRYYMPKYPMPDDVVMVIVRSIAETEACVYLLEYNNIEGRILLSDFPKHCNGSINKLICVGETEPVVVIRVDKEKGYIDLSNRRLSPGVVRKYGEKYFKETEVNFILRHVAALLNYKSDEEIEDLYKKTAWHFEDKFKKQSSSASFGYDIFKQAVKDPSLLDECGLDEKTKETLLRVILRKLGPPPVTIRAVVEVACNRYEGNGGIEVVGFAFSTNDIPIRVHLIAPSFYVITTVTQKRQDGLEALEDAIKFVQKNVQLIKGVCNVHMEPKVVTDEDEWSQMEKAYLERAKIGGDDDQSDMETEGSEEESDGEEEEDTKGADEQ